MTVHEAEAAAVKDRSPGRPLWARYGSFLVAITLVPTTAAGCFPSVAGAQAPWKGSSLVGRGPRLGLLAPGPYTGHFSGTFEEHPLGTAVLSFHGTALFATRGPAGTWLFTSGSLAWRISGHHDGCTSSGSGTDPLNTGNIEGSITVNHDVGRPLFVPGLATVAEGEYLAWLTPANDGVGPSMVEKTSCPPSSGFPATGTSNADYWEFYLYTGVKKSANFRSLSGTEHFGITYTLNDAWSFYET